MRLFFLCERCILLGGFRVLLCFGIDWLIFNHWRDKLKKHLIGFECKFVILKVALNRVSAILNVETPGTVPLTVLEFACIAEAIWQFQLTDSVHNSTAHFTRVESLVWEDNLAVTIGLVLCEVALKHSAVAHQQLAEALSDIHDPMAFVILFTMVSFSIIDLSVAVLLAFSKLSDILRAIVVSARALTMDLSIFKHACVPAAISHEKDSFARFTAIVKLALVLKVRVRVCVAALTVSQFCHWVYVTHVPIFRNFVFCSCTIDLELRSLIDTRNQVTKCLTPRRSFL